MNLKFICILFSLCLLHNVSYNQNLVPNFSFEEIDSCNFGFGTLATGWTSANIAGSPDLFHTCATSSFLEVPVVLGCEELEPQTGNAFAGILVYGETGREYLQIELETPLVADVMYHLSFYVSPIMGCSSQSNGFTDAIGMAFANQEVVANLPLNGSGVLSIQPVLENEGSVFSDIGNWEKVSGCYTAMGGESHVIIGSFKTDASTILFADDPDVPQNYFFIDDVSVIPFDPLPDTALLCEDTLTLNGTFLDTTLLWSTGFVGNEITVTEGGTYSAELNFEGCKLRDEIFVFDLQNIESFSVKDTLCPGGSLELNVSLPGTINWSTGDQENQITVEEAGSYQATVINECNDYVFDYEIVSLPCDCEIYIPNTFTPDGNQINDQLDIFIACSVPHRLLRFSVFNRWGAEVFSTSDETIFWDGTFAGQALDPGTFVWFLEYEIEQNESFITRNLKGEVTILK